MADHLFGKVVPINSVLSLTSILFNVLEEMKQWKKEHSYVKTVVKISYLQ